MQFSIVSRMLSSFESQTFFESKRIVSRDFSPSSNSTDSLVRLKFKVFNRNNYRHTRPLYKETQFQKFKLRRNSNSVNYSVIRLPNHEFTLQNNVQLSQIAATTTIPTEVCLFSSAVASTVFLETAEKILVDQTQLRKKFIWT